MARPKQFEPDVAVERAMEVFWRKGYARTTPQDLVEELGIGKGSLYHTFKSKHALFTRALRHYQDTHAVTFIEMLERPGPARERLRGALEALIEMDLGGPDRRGCLAVNTAAELAGVDADATDAVRRMFDRTESAFQSVIEEGRRSGEIASDRDPRALASLLLNTVVGMRVIGKSADGPDRLRRTVDALLDSV
jgi:TetR/AcrR family transcriptional repressor of nem operon